MLSNLNYNDLLSEFHAKLTGVIFDSRETNALSGMLFEHVVLHLAAVGALLGTKGTPKPLIHASAGHDVRIFEHGRSSERLRKVVIEFVLIHAGGVKQFPTLFCLV